MSTERGSDILAFTPTYGDRLLFEQTVKAARATSGLWFDWAVYAGAPTGPYRDQLTALLNNPDRLGIQHLTMWEENRGQHHATQAALQLAREAGYKFLLRIDDDVTTKSKRWLKKMMTRVEVMARKDKGRYRAICSPRITGLKNPLKPLGTLGAFDFPAEAMDVLGGACRLHPIEFLKDYEPPLLAPKGRQDPSSITEYVVENDGILVRFPDIRVLHATEKLEAQDSRRAGFLREMSYVWPYLGPGAPHA